MSSYCTLAEVRAYKKIGAAQTGDDALITDLIPQASQRIDSYCLRTFTVRTAETRKFDAVLDVDGDTLYLDDDL